MPIEDADAPEEIMWRGDWITACRRGKWEYAKRARGIKAAVILALEDNHVLLVEQYRVALSARTLELPAGLIGDEEGDEDEDPLDTAKRELLEETGYEAAQWEDLGVYSSSPGMTGETFTLLRATGLTRIGEGGGTESEDIVVHRLPLGDLPRHVSEFRRRGLIIDTRVLAALGPWLLGMQR